MIITQENSEVSLIEYVQLGIGLLVAIVFPLASGGFLFKKKDKLLDPMFTDKYGTLYGNVKTY